MHPVLNGRYGIHLGRNHLLTMRSDKTGAPIFIMDVTGNPGDQEVSETLCLLYSKLISPRTMLQWTVAIGPNGGITLKNLKYNMYAGFNGAPEQHKYIEVQSYPTEFQLEETGDRTKFRLATPPFSSIVTLIAVQRMYINNGQERLYLDYLPAMSFPPRVCNSRLL
jgi:hypothetical protein